jgi:hypothetical protein
MSIDWKQVTVDHVRAACRMFDSGTAQPKRPARNTVLILAGRRYPAKFIRGLAYKIATGTELNPSRDYSGGQETVRFFSRLGLITVYQRAAQTAKGPDTTQYQVMRLMHFLRWRHVRVLNLSDIRSPKSAEFIKQFQRLEDESNFDSHSVFSDARTDELSLKLPTSRKTSLVLAWGLSDKLTPLIDRCVSRIPRRSNLMGLLEPDTTSKYRHPLPSLQKAQRRWVDMMVRQFKA